MGKDKPMALAAFCMKLCPKTHLVPHYTALPELPSCSVELIPTVARAADVTMQQAGTSGIYCAVRTGWGLVS